MEKYISLDAVLAKIEKLFEKAGNSLGEYRNGAEHTLISIKDFLDTLEVKEVDLDLTSGIDDILEKNGINPNTTGAKIIKEAFYKAIDKRLTKAQKGEEV